PVLVISTDARNDRASDVLVIPCSTTMRDAPTHVRLRRGQGGPPEPCMLKCEQITTVPKDALDPFPIGAVLATSRLVEIERAVLRAIGVPACRSRPPPTPPSNA